MDMIISVSTAVVYTTEYSGFKPISINSVLMASIHGWRAPSEADTGALHILLPSRQRELRSGVYVLLY